MNKELAIEAVTISRRTENLEHVTNYTPKSPTEINSELKIIFLLCLEVPYMTKQKRNTGKKNM